MFLMSNPIVIYVYLFTAIIQHNFNSVSVV